MELESQAHKQFKAFAFPFLVFNSEKNKSPH